MAGALTTTITFANGDQVTSAKLNEIISGAAPTADFVTGTTLVVVGGQLKVGTITASEMGLASVTATAIAAGAVGTAAIAAGAVTVDKIALNSIGRDQIAFNSIYFSNFSTTTYASKAAIESQSAGFLVVPDVLKYSLGDAKAYGEFNITSTSRAIKSNSLNVASLARVDSTHTTVTLTAAMSSANYTVIAGFEQIGTAENLGCAIYDKLAGSFKIMHPAEATGRAVNFVVFGKLA